MFRSKKYKAAAAKVDANKLYTVEEACALVKETSTVKFDATIDVSFKLNIDPRQADQQVEELSSFHMVMVRPKNLSRH